MPPGAFSFSFPSRQRRLGSSNEPSEGALHGVHEKYGVMDYRSIKPSVFAVRGLLKPATRAKISIGILHVKVVEARGLMGRDGIMGKSDPYVKLTVTGRYLSSGQEWSEELRIQEKTRTIKFSQDPTWNEEFSLPVRRAGAVLRVEVWDWDHGATDDSLGSLEVNISEDLLSQKAIDRWYVLGCPEDWKMSPPAVPDAEMAAAGGMDLQTLSEMQTQVEEEEVAAEIMSGKKGSTLTVPLSWRYLLAKRDNSTGNTSSSQQDHRPREESPSSDVSIEDRRKLFGEVRLELRFEFNEFAETCSHIWPEEKPRPPETTFSPNRVYYNAILLQQLAQPYVSFMQGANAVVYWHNTWTSLLCFLVLVILLLHPVLLIVAINLSLLRIVVISYVDHVRRRQEDGIDGDSDGEEVETGRPVKDIVPKKSLLPPIDAPEDRQMQEMYSAVHRSKKLPNLVEQIGRRMFAEDGVPAQLQVETIGRHLTRIRRLFHPVKTTPFLLTVMALACHMLLQLWLFCTSRFHLYLLLICVGVFCYTFYRWRGRAFILAVQAARRNRQIRFGFTNNTVLGHDNDLKPTTAIAPAPTSETTPLWGGSTSDSIPPAREKGAERHRGIIRSEMEVFGQETKRRHPLLSPSGTTPTETSPVAPQAFDGPRDEYVSRKSRSLGVGTLPSSLTEVSDTEQMVLAGIDSGNVSGPTGRMRENFWRGRTKKSVSFEEGLAEDKVTLPAHRTRGMFPLSSRNDGNVHGKKENRWSGVSAFHKTPIDSPVDSPNYGTTTTPAEDLKRVIAANQGGERDKGGQWAVSPGMATRKWTSSKQLSRHSDVDGLVLAEDSTDSSAESPKKSDSGEWRSRVSKWF